MPPLAFAEQHLFGPLGIEDIRWNACPRGINTGSGGLWIRPEDLLKIGALCLNGGLWKGEQVVPGEWITASTTAKIDAGTLSDSYGYQWWVDRENYVMMMGLGGQYVIVSPPDGLVVVIISSLPGNRFSEPEYLFNSCIRGAVVTDTPIPEHPEALRDLRVAAHRLADPPDPGPVEPLPGKAAEISGKEFLLTPDSFVGFTDVSFECRPGADSFIFSISYRGTTYEMNVGLDGVYRESLNYSEISAHKGRWKDESSLVIDYEGVNYPEVGRYTFLFLHDGLIMYFEEKTSGIQVTCRGRLAD